MDKTIDRLAQCLRNYQGPPVRLMEVCGTHTHALSRLGIPAMLPHQVSLISGPGCPVCVTPAGYIDRAAELACQPHSVLLSFGDMLRVPGKKRSLLEAKASGGNVALMYSPLDALALAAKAPDTTFYVAAVGFETTLPLYALLIQRMEEQSIRNIRLLTAVKALLPGLDWLCQQSPEIDGFIGPGHVSAILGYGAYEPLCACYRLPLTVAGFEYQHLVPAIYDLVQQKKAGTHEVRNLYPSVVTREGNATAQALIHQYFVPAAAVWRGLGEIDGSGYSLAPAYQKFDAGAYDETSPEGDECLCGQIITGKARPVECPCFGTLCTPERPLGPCMVSSEGACGIWHSTERTL